jgi:hypothetical protein
MDNFASISVGSVKGYALSKNPRNLKPRSISFRLSMATSPARGERWVEKGDSRSFQSPFRDVMWVLYASRYPHHVPTGLGKTSGLLFSTHVTPLAGLPLCEKKEPIHLLLNGYFKLRVLSFDKNSSRPNLPKLYSPLGVGGSLTTAKCAKTPPTQSHEN